MSSSRREVQSRSVRSVSWSCRCFQKRGQLDAHGLSHSAEPFFISTDGIERHVSKDGLATEIAAGVGTGDERIRFDLSGAELLDIVFHVWLSVIWVPRVVEPPAASGFEVVDPTQVLRFDEVVVESESVDDETVGAPACRAGKVAELSAESRIYSGHPDRNRRSRAGRTACPHSSHVAKRRSSAHDC